MIGPGQLKMVVNRWQPAVFDIDFVAIDFTGATFEMEVRDYPDAPDPARITLGNADAPDEGISVAVATADGITTSTVSIRIDEATIEGLPFTNPKGTDLELVWDLVVTVPDGIKTRWLEGPFIAHGGSTQI